MLGYLIVLFVGLPLIELYLLLELGSAIGGFPTLALVVVTGVVGAALAKLQGLKVLGDIKFDLSVGNVPTDSIISGVLVLAAGLLLLTPGVLTDLLGFATLLPPVRKRFVQALKSHFGKRITLL